MTILVLIKYRNINLKMLQLPDSDLLQANAGHDMTWDAWQEKEPAATQQGTDNFIYCQHISTKCFKFVFLSNKKNGNCLLSSHLLTWNCTYIPLVVFIRLISQLLSRKTFVLSRKILFVTKNGMQSNKQKMWDVSTIHISKWEKNPPKKFQYDSSIGLWYELENMANWTTEMF